MPMDVAKLLNHVKLLCIFHCFTFDYLFLSHVRYNKLVSRALCSIWVRKMSGMNLKIDKFTRRNSFHLWQIKMRTLLKQQGLWAPLTKKSTDSVTAEMTTLEEKTHSMIMLYLADDIIIEVAEEETESGLWL